MLIQLANIYSGFVLSSPLLGKIPTVGSNLEKAGNEIKKYRNTFGMIMLVLGALNLIDLIVPGIGIPFINGGYTQTVIALLIGLVMPSDLFRNSSPIHHLKNSLKPYEEFIG